MTNNVIEYEEALKADGFLIVAHGPAEEMGRAKSVLATMNPTHLDLHQEVKDMPAPPADHAQHAM